MGSVYNSCAEHFATRKTLDSVAHEVLRALNVWLKTWVNCTLAGLLPRLVEFSLLYRFNSFFALTFSPRSTSLHMTVGKVVRNISVAVYNLDKFYTTSRPCWPYSTKSLCRCSPLRTSTEPCKARRRGSRCHQDSHRRRNYIAPGAT
ncbi:hypothetical protein MRX96_003542 [Rhipicephalus microplus]